MTRLCAYCDEPLVAGERLAYGAVAMPDGTERAGHVECAYRMVMGGWGHHIDHALWCVERGDPDGGLSRRESARRVWEARPRDEESPR